jgi:hypothetical protein
METEVVILRIESMYEREDLRRQWPQQGYSEPREVGEEGSWIVASAYLRLGFNANGRYWNGGRSVSYQMGCGSES